MDSSLDIQAIQLPALQYQHERRSHDWTTDDASSISGMTDVTDFTDSGTLMSEDYSNIKLNTGVRKTHYLLKKGTRVMCASVCSVCIIHHFVKAPASNF